MALPAKLDGNQLALIRRTVAKDTNEDEFRLFVHICQAVGLDPLRRQAMAFVFNKKDASKRQLTVVTSIGGYRSIADRTGNYRPDSEAPRYTMGEKNEKTNPLGIEKCEVTVFKHSHGEWWPVVGEAWWNEYVPLRDGEIDRTKQGWIRMPRIMISKCAEAQGLRKAWPDDFAEIHAEEETHREESYVDAVEAAEYAEQEARLEKIGGGGRLIIDWLNGAELEAIPSGQFFDRAVAHIRMLDDEATKAWENRNRHALKEFWALHKSDALELKKQIEEKYLVKVMP